MANKMLIDAAHPEETRVVVVRGNRVEEFDFESATRKQLRGNIYLAKVTRVEPSLQAAFVDYGGNRHGFLAFNEIHPDYYQIPVADRQALLEQDAAEEIAAEALEDAEATSSKSGKRSSRRRRRKNGDAAADADAETQEASSESDSEDAASGDASDADAENGNDADGEGETRETASADDSDSDASDDDNGQDEDDEDDGKSSDEEDDVESVGADDALEEVAERKVRRHRAYKIQEVIKRRQVILVQVVKEERGTKGAALTTYLSLAGRYCVLMPNTARGGGISRKITNPSDRRKIKEVASNLPVPEGMGLIIRTAGANRTKAEIKRDFEYLLRLWENVRDLTLQSSAPCLVYEEGSLIKRSIRDLYNKDVDSVQVEGDEAYREAKHFMKMLMPSHAKNVQAYKEAEPLYMRHQVEPQLDALFSSQCSLRSGGYLVINQTEALVAIDVNSGKSTKEHNIEDTALKTNLEAAEEVARQLRLRDLAGLIVIDFIDMEEKRNNRAVEKRLKERLKDDRARIQVGRISHFGLLEMSRQRMRSGVLEGSTVPCANCHGRGFVRSVESACLSILRSLEEHVLRSGKENLVVRASSETVLYLINQKRTNVHSIEERFGIAVLLEIDDSLAGSEFTISGTTEGVAKKPSAPPVVQIDSAYLDGDESEDEIQDDEGGGRKRRRRRRGRRKGRGEQGASDADNGESQSADDQDEGEERSDDQSASSDDDGQREKPRRRRGRRGGRRHKKNAEASEENSEENADAQASETTGDGEDQGDTDTGSGDSDGAESADVTAASQEQSDDAAPEATGDNDQDGSDGERSDADDTDESAVSEAASQTGEPPQSDTGTHAEASGDDTETETSAEADTDVEDTQAAEETSDENDEAGTDDVSEEAAPESVETQEDVVVEEKPAKPKRGWWQRRREASD